MFALKRISAAISRLPFKPYYTIPLLGTGIGVSYLPIMGFYTGFSQTKLETSQTLILDAVQADFKERGLNVKFTVEKVKLPECGYSLSVIKCVKSTTESKTGQQSPNPGISAFGDSDIKNNDKSDKPFVIMHGYGAGGAMFANNLAGLAYSLNRPVYAVDWIGFGVSDRPKFKETSPTKTLDFFLKPFEEWRKLMKFEKLDLMGHSLGGFLVGHYCANYSGEKYVDNLILASPAGVPHKPPPNPDREVPFVFKVFRKLWSWGFTPGGVIRGVGSWGGKNLVEKAVSKRFIHGKGLGLYGDVENLAVDYMHQMFTAPGSGEYAFYKLFAPGVYAHEPLIDELPKLHRTNVLFLYGTQDWMSISSARQCLKKMSGNIRKAADTVEGTHHLYLDSPEIFDEKIRDFLFK